MIRILFVNASSLTIADPYRPFAPKMATPNFAWVVGHNCTHGGADKCLFFIYFMGCAKALLAKATYRWNRSSMVLTKGFGLKM